LAAGLPLFFAGGNPPPSSAPPAIAKSSSGDTLARADLILSPESRETYAKRVLPFLKANCSECHDKETAKAGFCIDDLGPDFMAGKTASLWREATDKINLGKMPPAKKKERPNPHEAYAITEWVNQEIRNAQKRALSMGGRVPMRRMNRTEYANTVRDLFHLDDHFARTIERELPTDGKVDGFDRGGAALMVDRSLLQTYLDAAREVVAEAMPAQPPKVRKYRINALKDDWLVRKMPSKVKVGTILGGPNNLGFAVDYRNFVSDPKLLDRELDLGPQPNDYSIIRDGGVEASLGTNILGYLFRTGQPREVVKQDGIYRIRIKAGASRGSGKYAVDAVRINADYCDQAWNRVMFSFTIDAPLDKPKVYEKEVYLQSGGPDFGRVLWFRWNIWKRWANGFGDFKNSVFGLDAEFWDKLQRSNRYGGEFELSGLKNEAPEVMAAKRQKRDEARKAFVDYCVGFQGPLLRMDPDVDIHAVPKIWWEYIDLEGPFVEWPTKANTEIFFNGEIGDSEYARQIFTRFLPRAYRRPVDSAEVDEMVHSVASMQRLGNNFADAVRATIATVLISPDFLYLQEPTGDDATPHTLNDYELATRLSYLLWSSMPDGQLLDLAAQKKLTTSPETVRGQVKRMLADPRAWQFVQNFVGQWMRVRDFNTVMVDSTHQYKDYDETLRVSALREPYEFFHTLLSENLPVFNVLDSDFAMVNERLAKHYGIEGVNGEQFRRVPVNPESHRGGIMGMSGVMSYLSDGRRAMPVKRGAYLLDVLYNRPPPLPPPDAGDLPIVKGARSVRDRLQQHRARDTCAACHVKIDPYGLALENFDAVGTWQERKNSEGLKGQARDPLIDASGVLPDGKAFKDFTEFKAAVYADKNEFLNGFTEKLLAYALGRPISENDRPTIDKIIAAAAKDDYRLPSFLQAIVADGAFRTK
jgi:hypothetical protein